jgi:signal peptidase I
MRLVPQKRRRWLLTAGVIVAIGTARLLPLQVDYGQARGYFQAGLSVALNPGARMVRATPTGSMEPAITHRHFSVLAPVPFAEVRVGDIIAFTDLDGAMIVHRVILREDEALTTKGDNNEHPDPRPVRMENYRGKIVATFFSR